MLFSRDRDKTCTHTHTHRHTHTFLGNMKLQLNPGNDKQNNIWIVLLVSDKKYL